jgi:starch synthase (maltosyl-transferring)
MQSGNENMFIIRHFLAATLSSSYGFYGPVFEYVIHQAIPGKEEYLDSEKYEVRLWDWNKQTKLRQLITIINRIRVENPALQFTHNYLECSIQNEHIMAYAKATDDLDNIMLMVVNLDPYNKQSGWLKIPFEELHIKPGSTFVVHDLITDAKYTWDKEWNYIELDPNRLPYHLFKIEGINKY